MTTEPDSRPDDPTRSRWGPLQLGAVLLVGVVLGAVLTFVVQDRSSARDEAAESIDGAAAGSDGTRPDADGPPTQSVLLAWSIDPLPVALAGTLDTAPGVEHFTGVGHGSVGLASSAAAAGGSEPPSSVASTGTEDGQVVPIDAIAIDPAAYAAFVPPDLASTFAGLGEREVVLGRTGARLRGVGAGAQLRLVTVDVPVRVAIDVTVVAVVDDAVIGGAELAVDQWSGEALGLWSPRYVLVAFDGDRAAIEDAVRTVVPAPVRFRGPGETPFLRDGDAVLPQALIKDRFGEFAVSWSGTGVVQDAGWAEEQLVEDELPVIGRVRCHRGVLDDLRAAMEQIEREHVDYAVDPTPSSQACWYPDTIERTGMLSRGYWGVTVVLNSPKNLTGSTSVLDPRLVEIMQEHGFTWGGDFLVPEPSYFEHVGSMTERFEPGG